MASYQDQFNVIAIDKIYRKYKKNFELFKQNIEFPEELQNSSFKIIPSENTSSDALDFEFAGITYRIDFKINYKGNDDSFNGWSVQHEAELVFYKLDDLESHKFTRIKSLPLDDQGFLVNSKWRMNGEGSSIIFYLLSKSLC